MGGSPVELDIHWLHGHDGRVLLPNTPVVCWDLDSTLADTSHRQWMLEDIKGENPTLTWDDYSGACALDRPIPGSVRTAERLADNHLQLILTGRNISARKLTVHWLLEHGVPIDGLLMRPEGTTLDNDTLKIEWLRLLLLAGANVVLFVEDWDQSARSIEKTTGIPVLGVNPFYANGNPEAPADGFLPAVPGQRPAMERG